MSLRLIVLAAFANFALFGGLIGSITPTETELIATGGEVTVYFAGETARLDSVLTVFSPCCVGPFFPNHSTPIGTAFSLGTFAAGTPVRIRLDVTSTGESFYSGPAAGNPDGVVHVAHGVWEGDSTIPVSGIWVGFEDLYGGGDLDYDDNRFVFSQVRSDVTTPEPASMVLFTSALGGLALYRRLRRRSS